MPPRILDACNGSGQCVAIYSAALVAHDGGVFRSYCGGTFPALTKSARVHSRAQQ